MAVIGAGPIGIELAQAFQRLGSQVSVFSRSDKILPKEDPDAAKIVENALRRDGVTFVYHVNYRRVESQDGKPPVTIVLDRAMRNAGWNSTPCLSPRGANRPSRA